MPFCFLIARQRSGTQALGWLLDKHEKIQYLSEVFHDDSIDKEHNYFHFLQALIREDNSFVFPGRIEDKFNRYLEYLESWSKKELKIVDIKYSSLHHFNSYWQSICERPQIIKLIENTGFPIIHLTRVNLIKMYISGRLAEENRLWYARNKSEIKIKSISINVDELKAWLIKVDREVELVREFLGSCSHILHIDYSQLFNSEGGLNLVPKEKIKSFLAVETLELGRASSVKQTSDSLEAVIENYYEVESEISATKFSWMLWDGA